MIDLAGSERVSASGVTGDRIREASNINRSLSVLADVINALSRISEGRRSLRHKTDAFVPYRNSLLTWLLKDCLGGNSRTTMLATINPTEDCIQESISTLKYLERVKLISISFHANERRNAKDEHLADLLRINEELKVQIVLLSANKCLASCGCTKSSDFSSAVEAADANEFADTFTEASTELVLTDLATDDLSSIASSCKIDIGSQFANDHVENTLQYGIGCKIESWNCLNAQDLNPCDFVLGLIESKLKLAEAEENLLKERRHVRLLEEEIVALKLTLARIDFTLSNYNS